MEKEQVCPCESSIQDVISLNSDHILSWMDFVHKQGLWQKLWEIGHSLLILSASVNLQPLVFQLMNIGKQHYNLFPLLPMVVVTIQWCRHNLQYPTFCSA